MAEKQMDQTQSRRRRRDGSSGVQQRLCSHCGRSFKRSEHLERHVRTRWLPQPQIPIRDTYAYNPPDLHHLAPPVQLPSLQTRAFLSSKILFGLCVEKKTNPLLTDTKEKPYVCHCGSAYSRRDLLTRHQRITHETLSPRSPDAPGSEDNHQLASTDSDPPSEDRATVSSTASIPDNMSMNHNLHHQHQQFSNSSHDFGVQSHAASQPYNQLITDQGFYDNGQNYSTFDHYQELHNFPDGAGLPPEWSPYFHDPSLEQDLVDPALRGSMVDVSSPLANDNFSAHAYNPWMSPAAQKWSN
ncbi:hypothetical protein GGR54DRAFT_24304 [Hypoxylon sp. NC1633]|nr:hypothetical protein GGR54DRAFT_24304 [Hypoxylon sp. NC1633]